MEASNGIWLALHAPGSGRPVAVKDLFDTAGAVTTYGSAMFAEHVPRSSAAAVERLEVGGYHIAGKTNLHEFAFGISSQNEAFGTVPNPRYPGRLAGGSSGGSAAAVAAGDVDLALGSDSGGSIRIPAAWCGVVGFKPTFGLVPTEGCFPLAPSYDHAGPIASSVEGCAELMKALVPGFEEERIESIEDLAFGTTWLGEAEDDVRGAIKPLLELLPHHRPVDLPLPDRAEYALFMHEVADVHSALFPERADEYGENIRWKLEACLEVTDSEAARARVLRREYQERCADLVGGVDFLVAPTVAIAPPPASADERALRGGVTRLTYPFDSLGWPALAIPAGLTAAGLPASVQIVGRPGDDARVLAAGALVASLV